MRIGIGAILGVLGGPATYARELIRALAATLGEHELVVITDDPSQLDDCGARVRVVHLPLRSPWQQAFWDQQIPVVARQAGIDLYHGTKGILPLYGSVPSVVTIHDLAVYRQPETFAPAQRLHQRLLTPRAVRRAARIITDSEHARQDLLAQFGIPASRIVVIPLAVSTNFGPEPQAMDASVSIDLDLPPRFLLYAGTVQPRKRVDLLVEAFASLSGRDDLQLLIAGRLRPGYQPPFLGALPPGARYLGPVSETQLAILYRRALAFCSPSSYEGFGLSVLEAMQSGCPVIAAHNSSLPEVAGDAALWIDELSAASIAAAIERLLADPGLRDNLRALGLQRAQHFSWTATARRTMTVYEEVLRERC